MARRNVDRDGNAEREERLIMAEYGRFPRGRRKTKVQNEDRIVGLRQIESVIAERRVERMVWEMRRASLSQKY